MKCHLSAFPRVFALENSVLDMYHVLGDAGLSGRLTVSVCRILDISVFDGLPVVHCQSLVQQ